MKTVATFLRFFFVLVFGLPAVTQAGPSDATAAELLDIPAIKEFMAGGIGEPHENAPEQTEEFGQLVGVWRVEVEMRTQSGDWVTSAPGVWAWRYSLGGFAVSDLFYQSADNLPSYMANLGRDYLLSANRIFESGSGKWRVAWMANGAGAVMGADYGTFTAEMTDDELVMSSEGGGFGMQRVVFSDFSETSFRWESQYSQDGGKTWNAVMRMVASREAR